MANSSSFLESSSFSSPPPLRKVDDKFILGVLGTVDLWETTGTSFEFEFLSEDVLVVLDRVYHRVVKYRLTQEHPHIALISKHPLALPISRFSVLPGGRLAGLVNTKSKRGVAIYEFPDGVSMERIPPKLFMPFPIKFLNLLSRSNRNQLFGVAVVDGFLCLIVIDGDSLETISTRPFSVVTKEECQRSSISTMGLSPDSSVVFLVDRGLSSIIRMEVDSGNCRSFGHDFSSLADVIGLTFTNESILLHHHYKTVVMTSMGLRLTSRNREQYSQGAASSPTYLVTTCETGAVTVYKMY